MTAPEAGIATDPSDELVGRVIAEKYKVLRVLGKGGMGAVYEAEHLGLGKSVAIKFIMRQFASDEVVSNRFAREARAASMVESPHIVTVFDVGTDSGRPYFVMELLRGEDLGMRLRREHRLEVRDALHIIAQTLRGLSRAHEAGIVHRDLKPDNLFLVSQSDDPLLVKIVDFGISKIKKSSTATIPLALTNQGTVLGTPFYMAPEQAQAKDDIDERADLYGVGAILFELLSGRPPHTGESYEQVILAICMHDAPDLRAIAPRVPANVCAFVKRALERDRIQRFKSARQMLEALHEIAPEEKVRVPLEKRELQETARSFGVDESSQNEAPNAGRAVITPLEHGRDSAPASPYAKTSFAPPRESAPPAPPMRTPSRALTIAIAASAVGVLGTFIVLTAIAPKTTIVVQAAPPPSDPSTHAVASVVPSASALAPVASSLPSASASAPHLLAPSRPSALPHPSASAPSQVDAGLQLQRVLP